MLRMALHALSDGLPKGLAMTRDEAASAAVSASCGAGTHPPSPASFRQLTDVVFVDFTGWHNLTANMTKSALALVRTVRPGVNYVWMDIHCA